MQILRDPADIAGVADCEVRQWLQQRFAGMVQDGEPYDPDTYGWFVLLEPGDSLAALAEIDCPNPFHTYGDIADPYVPGFIPSFNWIQDWPHLDEIVTVLSDGGEFISLLLLKCDTTQPELRQLCQHYHQLEPEAY